MSDGKKRRYRKVRHDDKPLPKDRSIVIAKRDEEKSNVQKLSEFDVQPKILLRSKIEKDLRDDEAQSGPEISSQTLMGHKNIPLSRIETTQSIAISPNLTREQISTDVIQTPCPSSHTSIEEVPIMTRSATLMSSTGSINSNVKKLLMKTNTDFLVVGVIGMQGVGKSTIMNILANEKFDSDFNLKINGEENVIFPTRLKPHKCCSRPRTESMHMYITSDRIILLDTPPVLCNPYKKDATSNELDDLRIIISLYSICHLVIVVIDDYLSINLMRLLQLAEIIKPSQVGRAHTSDYFPNMLFIKNRTKPMAYIPDQKQKFDKMLKNFFKGSELRIFLWQAVDQRQRKGRLQETDREVNSFLFPEVEGAKAYDVETKLRSLVFMSPRNEICTNTSDFTETVWFDLLVKVSQETQNFFFYTYEEIERRHLEIGGGNVNLQNCTNSKDAHEN